MAPFARMMTLANFIKVEVENMESTATVSNWVKANSKIDLFLAALPLPILIDIKEFQFFISILRLESQ